MPRPLKSWARKDSAASAATDGGGAPSAAAADEGGAVRDEGKRSYAQREAPGG